MTQSVTPDLLRRVGVAIYGEEHWHTELVERLGVADRTFRRWLSGAMVPPPGITEELYRLAREPRDALDAVCRELRDLIE